MSVEQPTRHQVIDGRGVCYFEFLAQIQPIIRQTNQTRNLLPLSQAGQSLYLSQAGHSLSLSQAGQSLSLSQAGQSLSLSQVGQSLYTSVGFIGSGNLAPESLCIGSARLRDKQTNKSRWQDCDWLTCSLILTSFSRIHCVIRRSTSSRSAGKRPSCEPTKRKKKTQPETRRSYQTEWLPAAVQVQLWNWAREHVLSDWTRTPSNTILCMIDLIMHRAGQQATATAHWMWAVHITSTYPKFNGIHFDSLPCSIHRITGLSGDFVWAVTYVHWPQLIT